MIDRQTETHTHTQRQRQTERKRETETDGDRDRERGDYAVFHCVHSSQTLTVCPAARDRKLRSPKPPDYNINMNSLGGVAEPSR